MLHDTQVVEILLGVFSIAILAVCTITWVVETSINRKIKDLETNTNVKCSTVGQKLEAMERMMNLVDATNRSRLDLQRIILERETVATKIDEAMRRMEKMHAEMDALPRWIFELSADTDGKIKS